jgi:formylglycine-generating enzyme required for sulfatase activity
LGERLAAARSGGNYGGKAKLDPEPLPPNDEPLTTYEDDFVGTAPVGTFAPAPSGIWDLSGNVYEWCGVKGIFRGASTWDRTRSALLSSKRNFNNADFKASNVGFRVVLAPVD